MDDETIRRFTQRHTAASFALSGRLPEQAEEELEYGDTVPGVTCPSCGGELVHTSSGALCDECRSYVPIVGSAVHVSDDEDDESEWDDEG